MRPTPRPKHGTPEQAQRLKDRIVWSKYPRLAEIFENRPTVNLTWLELTALIAEMRAS